MRNRKWLAAVATLSAVALIAAGCGSDDSSSTTTTVSDTSATTSTESSSSSQGSTPDDVYNACIDAIQGTPAETAGQSACQQAKTAFEQCTAQAENAADSVATAASHLRLRI